MGRQKRKALLARIQELSDSVLEQRQLKIWLGTQQLIDNERYIILQIDIDNIYSPYITRKELTNGCVKKDS